MAKADAETWAFWAPLVYGVICVLVGFLVHGVVFPLIERGMYAASKRLDPLAWPTLVIFMDEIVAHRILVAVSRCILVSSIFGAVVLMNLGRDETHFGGPWIEQLVHSAVVVVCLQLVFRVVDLTFVLVMRDAHRAVSAGTNPIEVRKLYRALSRPSTASSNEPDPESTDEGRLDDAERGAAAPGCFGGCGKSSSKRDDVEVALDRKTEREFEERSMWIIKMRAALAEEQVALRKEIAAARDAQTERRRAVAGGGAGATPTSPASPASPASPRGSVPPSPGAGAKGSGTPGVDPEVIDPADAARYERAKRLDKRARELAEDQRALDRDIEEAKERVRKAERERVERERERWRGERRQEKKLRSRDANDPSMLTGVAWGPRASAALLYRRALKALFAYLFLGWFLSVWHANMNIFAAFSAVGALFVAFSLRDAAANVLGSLVIILYRPFAVGDWIRTDDPAHEGIVREINFRCTVLVRVDDLTPTEVPNAHFLRAAVSNISRQASFRHEFVLPLSVTVPAEKLRAFVNDARRAVESDGRVNAWVTLHSDPCGAGSNLGGRLVSFRFDFPRGPQSPENLADPEPLCVAGVPCLARRPWLEFLVARDDAVCAALACADAHGLVVGAHAGEQIAHTEPPKVHGGDGVARRVPALDRHVPEGGANEGGFDADRARIPPQPTLANPSEPTLASPSSPRTPVSPAPSSPQMKIPPISPKPAASP